MNRLASTVIILFLLCTPALATPLSVNITFTGELEQNETTDFFGMEDSFSGKVSYCYDDELASDIQSLFGRTFFQGYEINLSYEISVGDWNIYNQYVASPAGWGAYASMDTICTWSDEIPYQSGVDDIYYLDIIDFNPDSMQVVLHGINPNSSFPTVVGNITDINISIQPVPEPATLLLLGAGMPAILLERKRRKGLGLSY